MTSCFRSVAVRGWAHRHMVSSTPTPKFRAVHRLQRLLLPFSPVSFFLSDLPFFPGSRPLVFSCGERSTSFFSLFALASNLPLPADGLPSSPCWLPCDLDCLSPPKVPAITLPTQVKTNCSFFFLLIRCRRDGLFGLLLFVVAGSAVISSGLNRTRLRLILYSVLFLSCSSFLLLSSSPFSSSPCREARSP